MSVSVSYRGDVALVVIDNPPVNATSQPVREGLLRAAEQIEAEGRARAVVLACAGSTFVAGADIREFGQPPAPPLLPDLIARIEASPLCWVAAIHGAALGGGLELALGCDYRVAAPDARLGLPEVTLGLIPGAGGTVRLPRLVAPELALEMIAGGKPVPAARAHQAGLVDRIAGADLVEDAIAFAGQAEPRAPLLARPARAPEDPQGFEKQAARFVARARGQISVPAAVDAVRNALSMPAEDALAAERAAFIRLRDSDQSAALRYIFFAERETARHPRLGPAAPREIGHVGIVGGGTMGAGIAAACLLAGLRATMVERDAEAAGAGRKRVLQTLADSEARGVIDAAARGRMEAAFDATADHGALAPADLVIEAVFEDMAVKREVFARLDAVTRPDAILATNTSYLDVNEIARGLADPSRVLGLHFFSPAHVMKLLEIVAPEAVAADVLATALKLAKRLRKIPVVAGVCDGFIANRIMSAYRREADYMLEDGALPWEIDAAMTRFGLPMGVFQMQDLAGLDIAWAMRRRRAATRDPVERYVEIADRLCEMGRFGRKTGRGWYLYDAAGKATPDPEVEALVLAESARKGIARRPMGADEIMARLLGAMQAEARAVLAEGIAVRASDIDVVMVNAFGFPRWRGGPMYMAGQRG